MILSMYPITGAGSASDEIGIQPIKMVPGSEDPVTDIPQVRNDLFIENKGQWRDDIGFIGSTSFGSICLGQGYIEYVIDEHAEDIVDKGMDLEMDHDRDRPSGIERNVIRIRYGNADEAVPTGISQLDSYSNYFYGRDPEGWVSDARHFEKVGYINIWDGIDIEFYFNTDGLKYDIILHPGADPDHVLMKVDPEARTIHEDGNLGFAVKDDLFLFDGNLRTFYESDEMEIHSEFVMISDNSYRFNLDVYDDARTVIIDPLVYSSYIGGSQFDHCHDIELDGSGNVYVLGDTASSDFFVGSGTYDTSHNGRYDLFIMKFDQTGYNLIFTTFLGSTGQEMRGYLEIDSNGDLIVLGNTAGDNFPVIQGAYDTGFNGMDDMTLSKLSSDGRTLRASTYFGGSSHDFGYALTLDDEDRPYVTGYSWSTNLPTTAGVVQPTAPGGHHDSFVSCLSSDLSSLEGSTYLGGDGRDEGYGVLIDGSGNIFVTGDTYSTNFPTTLNANEREHLGEVDAFLTVLDSTMVTMKYSTFIGGNSLDRGYEMVIGSDNCLYMTGYTGSSDFPITPGAYEKEHSPVGYGFDVFLMRINARNWTLEYSTVIGGYERDYGMSLELDERHQVYLTGLTESNDFPVTFNAPYRIHNGNKDVFVLLFNLTTSSILYSSYMGGPGMGNEEGHDLELTSDLDVWITGYTSDYTFNITANAFDNYNPGGNEGILLNFHIPDPPDAPSGLEYNILVGAIQLDWTEPLYQGDDRLIGYHIYRGVNGSKLSLYKSVGTGTFYKDEDITNYNTYQYLITGYGWIGESLPSNKITVRDEVLPVIDNDMTQDSGLSGKEHEFRFKITDNVGVSQAKVQIRYGTLNEEFDLTNLEGTDQWIFILKIERTFAGELQYRLWIEDHGLNVLESDWKIVNILDRLLPYVLEDRSETSVIAGTNFTIEVQVADNIGVEEVSVEYWFWDGIKNNISMGSSSIDLFRKEIEVGSLMGTISYRFYLGDVSGNWNKSLSFSREITDEVPPKFGMDLSSAEATTGDRFVFQVNVTENVGILGAFVEYWIGSGDHYNKTLIGTYDPKCGCDLPSDAIGELKFFFSAQDVSGNWARTRTYKRIITDNDPPTLDPEWLVDETAGTGDILSIEVPIEDNVKLEDIQGYFSFDDDEFENRSLLDGQEILSFDIPIPIDQLGLLRVRFSGTDTSGNVMETSTYNITVVDNKRPTISPIDNVTVNEGQQFEISFEALDNIGVTEMSWEGFPINHSGQIFNGSIDEPGVYSIRIVVKDDAGNTRSQTFTLTILDVKEDTTSSSTGMYLALGGGLLVLIILVLIVLIVVMKKRRAATPSEVEQDQATEQVKEEVPDYHQSDLLNPIPLTEEQRSFLYYGSTSEVQEAPAQVEQDDGDPSE